jgi:hypothetical protein
VGEDVLGDREELVVPLLPGLRQSREHLGLAVAAVGAFALVGDDVEEELVVVDPQVLPVAVADRALALRLRCVASPLPATSRSASTGVAAWSVRATRRASPTSTR